MISSRIHDDKIKIFQQYTNADIETLNFVANWYAENLLNCPGYLGKKYEISEFNKKDWQQFFSDSLKIHIDFEHKQFDKYKPEKDVTSFTTDNYIIIYNLLAADS